MSILHRPTLIPADQYPRDLVKKINKAKYRISIVATTFRDDDPRSHAIVEAICAAADRGVMTSVLVDTFTYLEPKEFIIRSPKRQPARAIQALKLRRKLMSHGVVFHWLGRSATNLAAGRTHSKWVIVDDIVYAFGGINLENESFTNTDFMFRIYNTELADFIENEQMRIRKADRGGGATRSRTFSLNTFSTVLADGGLIGDSLIYRRATQLAKEADSIVLVSQYCPTGRLGRVLKRKQAALYFNHWRHASAVNRFMISAGMITAKQQTNYHRDNYLHAKFIIYTMPDGAKVALTGSHNFMFGSGAVGTREIALETTDPHIIRQLERFRDRYVI